MALRTELHQTDLGVYPIDWEQKIIEDFNPYVTSGSRGWASYYSDYGEPFIRITNLTRGWIYLDLSDLRFVKLPSNSSEGLRTRLRENDILISITADIGIVGFVTKDIPQPAYINQHISLVRFNSDSVHPKFVSYFMASTAVQKVFRALTDAGAKAGMNLTTVKQIKFMLPSSKKEQEAIANALSDADAYIESLEKLIKKKKLLKTGLMQKLLKPQEHWEHKTLGEIGAISGAGVDKLIKKEETPVRLLNFMDVFRRDFIFSDELSHWVTAPNAKVRNCAIQKGDVFFTPSSEMRYDIAVSAVAMEDISDAVYSYHLIRFRLHEDWDLNFRNYVFKTRYFLDQAETLCEGSGKRYVLTLPKFRSLKIYYPKSKSEQLEISSVLFDIDEEINSLYNTLLKSHLIKQGMMQELLTGRIRLV